MDREHYSHGGLGLIVGGLLVVIAQSEEFMSLQATFKYFEMVSNTSG